jgi:hypothetical protein
VLNLLNYNLLLTTPADRGRVTGLAGFEGGLTIHARTLPMFAPMLDSGVYWLLGTSVRKIGRLRQYDISLLSFSLVNI